MDLNIGIIGTGWFSKVHGDILAGMDRVRVAAVLGTGEPKAEAMAARYPGARGYAGLTEMLDREKLDAVYICVPPKAHGEIESELIGRGIPFLVEKPIGTNMDIPSEILGKLQRKPLVHAVGYHFRYKATIQMLKERMAGQTLAMALGTWMGDMPQVSWWRRQEGSGGQFIEQTTHIVDLLRYLAGEVEEVYASYANRIVHTQFEQVGVPDVGTVTLKLRSGAIANISNTCALPGGVGEVGLKLYTGSGMLHWNPDRLDIVGTEESTSYKIGDNPYLKENEAFIHALRTGDTSGILSDYADALRTQRITCAALESASSGKPVKIEN